jgi:hypothetical protein
MSGTILTPYLLLQLCSRDATRVAICICGGCCEEINTTSANLPYDSDEPPPTKELRDVIDYCCSRKE